MKSNKSKKYLGRLRRKVGSAINDYTMIEANDAVLVAFSGGKDSMVLLDALAQRRIHMPVDYTIHAAYVYVTNFTNGDEIEQYRRFCQSYDIDFHVCRVTLDFSDTSKAPCFICSWHRRKNLFTLARNLGCKKIAFGHHRDDILETFIMNMVYHGNMSTMPPRLELFDGEMEIIRPLAYLSEKEVIWYRNLKEFNEHENKCPYKTDSKRSDVKEMLKQCDRLYKNARTNIFRSLSHRLDDYLL